jgi:hypothetical protein
MESTTANHRTRPAAVAASSTAAGSTAANYSGRVGLSVERLSMLGPLVSSSFDGAVVVVGINGALGRASAPRLWRDVYAAVDRAARSSAIPSAGNLAVAGNPAEVNYFRTNLMDIH